MVPLDEVDNYLHDRAHARPSWAVTMVDLKTPVSAALSWLSSREADRMLADAERERLAEIDRYWALCHAEPELAARMATGAAPIVGDLHRLARNTVPVPRPGTIPCLAQAAVRLLAVDGIREALLEDGTAPIADPAHAFWENGLVVGLKTVKGEQVLVLRYDGPLFNPGTVPESALTGDENCCLACHAGDDGHGGEYEFLTAYVTGIVAAGGSWHAARIDLASRSDMMRDLEAMETLVQHGRLCGEHFTARPLVTFPTGSGPLIDQLQAHKAALRLAGAIAPAQQALVDSRLAPLHERARQLRRTMRRIEDELYQIRCRMAEVEACALEDETGFARGDKVRHRFTGAEGALEIVHLGGAAQFRLCDSGLALTEDIRRGEWVIIDPDAD